jgi:hypothetical protein
MKQEVLFGALSVTHYDLCTPCIHRKINYLKWLIMMYWGFWLFHCIYMCY